MQFLYACSSSQVGLGAERRAQVISDPAMNKSGTYWSWSSEKGSFENTVSEEVSDGQKGKRLWMLSEKLVGLA